MTRTTFFIFFWVHKGTRNLCLQFNCFPWSNESSVWGANSLRKPCANYGWQRMSFTKSKHSIRTSSNFHMENKNYGSWPGTRLFLLTKWISDFLQNVENTSQEKNAHFLLYLSWWNFLESLIYRGLISIFPIPFFWSNTEV